jgi:23S rRNA maturation mini-RNase III
MTEIVLTGDQMHQLASATDDVVFADGQGNVIVRLQLKFTEKEEAIIKDAKRRLASDQPRIPSSEVLARLKRLNDQSHQ